MTEEEMLEAWRRWYRQRYGTEHMEQIIADARALVDSTPAPTPRRPGTEDYADDVTKIPPTVVAAAGQ
jgi:hypothetical protein